MAKRGEVKGESLNGIRIDNERLRELAKLTETQRTKLRKAIIKGQRNGDAAATADCPVHAAITMRARLDGLGLIPKRPAMTPPRRPKVDERQINLLDELGA